MILVTLHDEHESSQMQVLRRKGWLVRVKLRGGEVQKYVCEECEATFECTLGSGERPTDFQDWLDSVGVEPVWTSVEEIVEKTV
jgi:hypothetical protein